MKRIDKKGFTLVELLAVIVILALLMAVAVTSIGGVINNSQRNSMRSTAANILESIRLELTTVYLTGNIPSGVYTFSNDVVDKGIDAPLGGKYIYYQENTSKATRVSGERVFYIKNSGNVTTITNSAATGTIANTNTVATTTTKISCAASSMADPGGTEVAKSNTDASFILARTVSVGGINSTKYAICLKGTSSPSFWATETGVVKVDSSFFSDNNPENSDVVLG